MAAILDKLIMTMSPQNVCVWYVYVWMSLHGVTSVCKNDYKYKSNPSYKAMLNFDYLLK